MTASSAPPRDNIQCLNYCLLTAETNLMEARRLLFESGLDVTIMGYINQLIRDPDHLDRICWIQTCTDMYSNPNQNPFWRALGMVGHALYVWDQDLRLDLLDRALRLSRIPFMTHAERDHIAALVEINRLETPGIPFDLHLYEEAVAKMVSDGWFCAPSLAHQAINHLLAAGEEASARKLIANVMLRCQYPGCYFSTKQLAILWTTYGYLLPA